MKKLNSQTVFFLRIYFAFLGAFSHSVTIAHWRSLHKTAELFPANAIDLIMTFFWISYFLIALFPSSALLRYGSCASLITLTYFHEHLQSPLHFVYLFLHLLICLHPGPFVELLQKMLSNKPSKTALLKLCLLMAATLASLYCVYYQFFPVFWFSLIAALVLSFFFQPQQMPSQK